MSRPPKHTEADDSSQPAGGWRFGDATLDLASLELRVRDNPVPLERKPLEVLKLLLSHAGEVVTKEELLAEVWSGRVVTDATLTKAVAKLRAALGDDEQAIIRTVHGYGYRLMAPVTVFTAAGADAPSALELTTGMTVPQRPHWRLEHALGRGGFAEVWLAEHSKTHDRRVFKFAGTEPQLAALRREVTLYRLLRQTLGERRDIVQILDWNFEEPPFFIETEYVPAGSLLDWASAEEPLAAMPLSARLELLAAVADVVADAHAVGVLHKDLKPANVLLEIDADGHARPRLADFGSGRLLQPDALADYGITRMGFTRADDPDADPSSGTPTYLAPEVANGEAPTVQSDVYALGVMLYQLVVGDLRQPLAAGWEADVPDELLREDIAATANGDPTRRLGDARLLAERLRGLEARRATRADQERLEREASRARAALARARARRPWLIGSVVVLLLGMSLSTWQWQEARLARAAAEREAARSEAVNAFLTEDLLAAANPYDAGGHDVSIKDLLERAVAALDAGGGLEPSVESAVRRSIGMSFLKFGEDSSAESQLRLARALAEESFGESAVETREIASLLAEALAHQGRFGEVREMLDALAAPEGSLEHLEHRLLIAEALRVSRDLSQAVEVYEAVHRDLGNLTKPPAELRERVGDGLLKALHDAGRLADALPLIEGHQDLLRERHGDDSVAFWNAKALLAIHHRDTGNREAAERVYLAVRERLTALLGSQHPVVASILHQLSSLYIQSSNPGAAVEYAREAFELRREQFGDAHPHTLASLNNIAVALRGLEQFEEALVSQSLAEEIATTLQGPESPLVLSLRFNRGLTLVELGRLDEARPLLEEAADRAPEVFDGVWQGHAAFGLGRLHQAAGQVEDAAQWLERALALYAEHGVAESPSAQHVRETLAALQR